MGVERASAEPAVAAPAPRARRRSRLAAKLVLALLVPPVSFGVAELALRATGSGYDAAFLVPAVGPDLEGKLMTNPRFGWRFFPRDVARQPEALVLEREKPPGSVRIFVLGSSAAQGFPDPGTGIARVLEVLLRNGFDGVEFEVVNAAMVAINSHVVVDIARDCASPDGGDADAFVVYEGNNEVIGPFGPGTVFEGFRASRAAIRTGLWARRLRLGQLVDALRRPHGELTEWTGMELFLDRRVAADDPDLVRTAEQFRANLVDICRAATEREKPVVLCTVGVNLRDCAPFASEHRPDLSANELAAWESALAAGSAAVEAGDDTGALARYRDAGADWVIVGPVDSSDPQNATMIGAELRPRLR
jgi:hypothetical protein